MVRDFQATPPPPAQNGLRLGIAAAIIVLVVAACHSIWVSLYGADLPFWDQWVQVISQLAPLKNGTWQYSEYWAPHNEHRVLFTRLISMALFEMNGGIWSNLVEAYFNTVIYGGTLALFYVLACRNADRATHLTLLFAVLILGAIPYDWENTLVGFQNQFYLLIASAIALVSVASYRKPGWSTFGLLVVLAIACLFTMASGLLSAAAVCVVIVLRAWRSPLPKAFVVSVVLAMMLVLLGGLLSLPEAPGNDPYKAHGIFDHVHAIAMVLTWPLIPTKPKYFLLPLLTWAPCALWLIRFLRTRIASDREIFFMGVIAWVLLQAVAIAHARGHDITSVPSRYSNIPTLGLLANLGLALGFVSDRRAIRSVRYLGTAAIGLAILVIAHVFVLRTPDDMDSMQQRHDFNRMETFYTRSYLTSRDPSFLHHSSLSIPFPDAALLKTYLDSPVVDSLLPPTLQPPGTPGEAAARKSGAQTALDVQAAIQGLLAEFGSRRPSIFFQEALGDSATQSGAKPIGSCSVTNVNEAEVGAGPITAKPHDPLRFYGWIVNPQSRVTNRFFIVLAGTKRYELEVDPFMRRRDVERVMHSKRRETFGFRAYGILPDVPPGSYAVQLATPGDHGQVICNLPYQLVVAP